MTVCFVEGCTLKKFLAKIKFESKSLNLKNSYFLCFSSWAAFENTLIQESQENGAALNFGSL